MKHTEDEGTTTEDVWNTLECVSDIIEYVRDTAEYGSNEMKAALNTTVEKNRDMTDGGWDVAEEIRRWGLVRAVLRNRPRNDDEDIEEKTEPGEAEDNRCDRRVDLPKITG